MNPAFQLEGQRPRLSHFFKPSASHEPFRKAVKVGHAGSRPPHLRT